MSQCYLVKTPAVFDWGHELLNSSVTCSELFTDVFPL